MSLLLDRKKLLEKEKFQIKKIDFEDGSFIFVREMSGHERELFESSLMNEETDEKGDLSYKRSMEDFRAKLAVCTLCDNGVLILKSEDYTTLSKNMTAKTLTKIADTAQSINRISKEDKENLIKNSEAAQSGDSNLDSVKS